MNFVLDLLGFHSLILYVFRSAVDCGQPPSNNGVLGHMSGTKCLDTVNATCKTGYNDVDLPTRLTCNAGSPTATTGVRTGNNCTSKCLQNMQLMQSCTYTKRLIRAKSSPNSKQLLHILRLWCVGVRSVHKLLIHMVYAINYSWRVVGRCFSTRFDSISIAIAGTLPKPAKFAVFSTPNSESRTRERGDMLYFSTAGLRS